MSENCFTKILDRQLGKLKYYTKSLHFVSQKFIGTSRQMWMHWQTGDGSYKLVMEKNERVGSIILAVSISLTLLYIFTKI